MRVTNLLGFFFLGENPLADDQSNRDINSVAGVLKLYFRGLENPLFPKERFNDLISCVSKWAILLFVCFFLNSFPTSIIWLTNSWKKQQPCIFLPIHYPITTEFLRPLVLDPAWLIHPAVASPFAEWALLLSITQVPQSPRASHLVAGTEQRNRCQLTEGKAEAVSMEMLTVFWLLARGLFHHLCYLGKKGERR